MNQQTIYTDKNGRRMLRDHFIYVVSVDALAAGQTKNSSIAIEADSSFTLVKLSYASDVAGAAQTVNTQPLPIVDVAINDSGSGRNLQNKAVPLTAMAGNGELPFVLPIPRIFQPSSNINFTFTSREAVTEYAKVSLVLVGYKEWSL